MAWLSIRTLAEWFHNVLILTWFWLLDFQRMVTVPDYDYYKSRGMFFLFGTYVFFTIAHKLMQMDLMNIERKTKLEKLKAQRALRRYIESKTEKGKD